MEQARLPVVRTFDGYVGLDRLVSDVQDNQIERRALLGFVRRADLDGLDRDLQYQVLSLRVRRRGSGRQDADPTCDQARGRYGFQSVHDAVYRLPDLTNSPASPTTTATITAMPMNPKELDWTAVMRNCSSSDSRPTTVSSLRL